MVTELWSRRGLRQLAGALALTLLACGAQDQAAPPSGLATQKAAMGGIGPPAGPTNAYDVQYLQTVEHPNLRNPLRISVAPDGRFAVSDPGAGCVHLIAANGMYIRPLRAVPSALGVAFLSSDELLVGSMADGAIFRVTTEGLLGDQFGASAGPLLKPNDIDIAPDGSVWFVDSGHQRIVTCDVTGETCSSFGEAGTAAGQLSFPIALAVTADGGEIYVSDTFQSVVHVFDPVGTYLRTIGDVGAADGEFVRPGGLDFDPDGRLYVSEIFQGRVQAFAGDDTFLGWISQMGVEPGELGLPGDVVFDGRNRLAITSYRTGRVEIYGVGDYDVVPGGAPAIATLVPGTLHLLRRAPKLDLYLDIPASTAAIDAATVRINGSVAADPPALVATDIVHAGHLYEGKVRVRTSEVLDLVGGPGEHLLAVTGSLTDGVSFEGSAVLTAVSGQ